MSPKRKPKLAPAPPAAPEESELGAAMEIAGKDAIDAAAEPGLPESLGIPPEAHAAEETPASIAAGDEQPAPDNETATGEQAGPDSGAAEASAGGNGRGEASLNKSRPDAGASEADALEAPQPKLERLQKILAQAGIASRRHAEELITEGRVQVNGQTVTTLGSKADAARDHIRVDGKAIHPAERHRYFVLNKPKGYVTTASDPEGRPTVMQFFAKMPERLYPVGRLDYQSEGLLLVTNDGELAHKLTRASAGVEKTYLVKVSGRPTEEELDRLRQGVEIERGQPGSEKVDTAPARIRPVRKGDNPWFEVVLTEGRNRELRKMFQEIGHFVEKIRRVGYGPLILDLEPGHFRELDPEELALLRKAAEGKWRAPRPKETPRRQTGRESARREPGAFRRGPQQAGGGRPFPPAEGKGRFEPRGPKERTGRAQGWDQIKPGRPAGPPRERRPERDSRGERPFGGRPEWRKPDRERQPGDDRPARDERFADRPRPGRGPDRIPDRREHEGGGRSTESRGFTRGRPAGGPVRPAGRRPGPGAAAKPGFGPRRVGSARPPGGSRPAFRSRPEGFARPDRPAKSPDQRGSSARPGGFSRPGKPADRSSGRPRAGGFSRPGKPADRRAAGPRPAGKRPGGSRPNSGSGRPHRGGAGPRPGRPDRGKR